MNYWGTTTLIQPRWAIPGKIENGALNGDIIITGSGDPSLGSWRYSQTTEESILAEFKKAISREGINRMKGHVYADEENFGRVK